MKFSKIFYFSIFSFFSNILFSSSEQQEVLTFNPQIVIENLDAIKEVRDSIDLMYRREFESLQAESNVLEKKKQDLNREIQEKGAALDQKVIEQKYSEIVKTESVLYEKQVSLENRVRASVIELSNNAKSIIDKAIEVYLSTNKNSIIIATEYKQNEKFDITNKLVSIANDDFKKTKNVDTKTTVVKSQQKNDDKITKKSDLKSKSAEKKIDEIKI